MSTAPYQPLLNLPDPLPIDQSPPVDLPSEILFENQAEFNQRFTKGLYIKLIFLGAVIFMAQYLLLISAISPIIWMLPIFALGDFGMFLSFFQQLGTSFQEVALYGLASPVAGGLAAWFAIWWGKKRILKLRPREFSTEAAFQTAVAQSIAGVFTLVQVAVVALLILNIALPIRGMIKDFSFTAVASIMLMLSLAYLANLWMRGIVRKANLLNLSSIPELQQRIATAPNAKEYGRLLGIMYMYDYRHLPPNPAKKRVRYDGRRRSLLIFFKASIIPAVVSTFLTAPVLYFVDLAQAFSSPTMGTASFDPQAGHDFSLGFTLITFLALAWWLLAANYIPAVAASLVNPAKNPPHDQRVFPTVQQRLAVNPWEKKVLNLIVWLYLLNSIAIWAVWLLILTLLEVIQAQSSTFYAGYLGAIYLLVWLPLSTWLVKRQFNEELRTVFYGPASLYARRQIPIAAIAPVRGNRSELAKDPRVQARIRAEKTRALGLQADASLALQARVAAGQGQLPDFGIKAEPKPPSGRQWLAAQRQAELARQGNSSEPLIPSSINDLPTP